MTLSHDPRLLGYLGCYKSPVLFSEVIGVLTAYLVDTHGLTPVALK